LHIQSKDMKYHGINITNVEEASEGFKKRVKKVAARISQTMETGTEAEKEQVRKDLERYDESVVNRPWEE
jgi:hypothetical protein